MCRTMENGMESDGARDKSENFVENFLHLQELKSREKWKNNETNAG